MILTLDEILDKLSDRNLKEVARRINMHHITLLKIVNGKTPNPSWQSIKKLSDYLTRG